jgi:hypothetical protein
VGGGRWLGRRRWPVARARAGVARAWSAFGLPLPPYIGGQAPGAGRPSPLQVGEGSRVPTRTDSLLP